MSVTYPKGFRAAGMSAGLKPSGRPDLGLLVGDPGTAIVGVFTTNRVSAAPVRLTRDLLSAGHGRAVIVNSGQANAATGYRGDIDARAVTAATAASLGMDANDVLACSTGVIGEPVHLEPLVAALPMLAGVLSTEGGPAFARAIMTTDRVDKQATADAGAFRVGGCAKGVGMIAPNLATMLVFVTTDAPVNRGDLQRLTDEQLMPRFNALTVDACTSTNDTVLVFASGAVTGEAEVSPGRPAWDALSHAIGEVGESLVRQLIADAEGVTHVMLIDIAGAPSEHDARVVAKAIADSPLVKTAMFGGDPNPGRILQAVGSSGIDVDPHTIDISIGGVRLVNAGVIPPAYFDDGANAQAARVAMKEPEIRIEVSLGDGPGRS
ncbi:MAG: bifunctional glutamate N-acetyltransferase/amino-acid acetyltransferase ArgJ, partial [Actinomycetota bacterium]